MFRWSDYSRFAVSAFFLWQCGCRHVGSSELWDSAVCSASNDARLCFYDAICVDSFPRHLLCLCQRLCVFSCELLLILSSCVHAQDWVWSVCVCVCVRARARACVCVCVRTCMCACMHMLGCIHMLVCMHMHVYNTCMQMCSYCLSISLKIPLE